MPSTSSWPSADDADRRVRIIDDLLGAILVLAALAFAALLELTRRRVCAVYQLAFLLCACCAVFIVGGLVDHHLSDEQLHLALHGSFLSSSLTTTYVYLPLGASAAVALFAGIHLSQCSCECCCLAGSRSASHRECFAIRFRANAALYATSFVILWVLIGIRLNARLRASAINPIGGTVHWLLLRSPFCLTVSHIGSIAIVELKLFLQHADKPRDVAVHSVVSLAQSTSMALSASQAETMASTVEKLMQPPPISKIRSPTAAQASISGMVAATTAAHIVRRPSRPQTPDKTTAIDIAPKHSGSSPPVMKKPNGDVSALISSDSESDEDALTPNFTTTRPKVPSAAAPTGAARLVGSVYSSAYSSSRPASPALSSVSSRSSSSSSSSSSSRSRPAPRYPRPSEKTLTRARSVSSEHVFDSKRYLSDTEDSGGKLGYYYYSDSNNNRPSSASSTTSSFSTLSSLSTSTSMSAEGIRRRIPHTNAADAVRAAVSATSGTSLSVKSPWVEYFDAASGSAYIYNQVTGESRWKSDFR